MSNSPVHHGWMAAQSKRGTKGRPKGGRPSIMARARRPPDIRWGGSLGGRGKGPQCGASRPAIETAYAADGPRNGGCWGCFGGKGLKAGAGRPCESKKPEGPQAATDPARAGTDESVCGVWGGERGGWWAPRVSALPVRPVGRSP